MRNRNVQITEAGRCGYPLAPSLLSWMPFLLVAALCGLVGCRGTAAKKQNTAFFTSGSREADQRASQRMAKSEELSGSGEGAGETGVKKASGSGNSGGAAPG